MNKKQDDKPNIPSPPSPGTSGHERRFHWWYIILASIVVPVLIALIPWLRQEVQEEPPRFALVNPVTRPDSGIIIQVQNRSAMPNRLLNIEFDGLLFANAGKVIPDREPSCWHFSLANRYLPDSLLADGKHHLRVGFAGDSLAQRLNVYFHSQAPVAEVTITHLPDQPQNRSISGRVASKLQAPAETLSVEIAFHTEGSPMNISLPVKKVINQETGLEYFEFSTTVEGLPKISQDDPRVAQPFFGIRVSDQAGNVFFQEESYDQFTARGEKRFGVNSLSDIEVQRLPVDLRDQTRVTFRLTPNPRPLTHLTDGQPAIFLKVTSLTENINRLEWDNLPDELKNNPPVTEIFRNDEHLTLTFATGYTDKQAAKGVKPVYRVQQSGRDGETYSSNAAAPKRLFFFHTIPQQLSESDVKQILKKYDFFSAEYDWNKGFNNPAGKGIRNQFQLLQEGKVVYDVVTDLMWQQSGSGDYIDFEKAGKYIEELNHNKFAGYTDWRLPTLEEAMSLMEPKKSGDLFINPIFDGKQEWIWTSDKGSVSRAWVVYFFNGYCDPNHVDGYGYYVRAVRAGQSNL